VRDSVIASACNSVSCLTLFCTSICLKFTSIYIISSLPLPASSSSSSSSSTSLSSFIISSLPLPASSSSSSLSFSTCRDLSYVFKENARRSRGRLTDIQLARCSQLAGPLAKAIDAAYDAKVANTYVHKSLGGKGKTGKLVPKFVAEYRQDRLFAQIPGREHKSFPEYKSSFQNVASPEKLNKRLEKYSQKLDLSRDSLPV
jgi:hypothetical protein